MRLGASVAHVIADLVDSDKVIHVEIKLIEASGIGRGHVTRSITLSLNTGQKGP